MSRRASRPVSPSRRTWSRRPRVEFLESRELLSDVTSAADSGPGTLRAAIIGANADNSVGAVPITFHIANGGLQTISLLSPLPSITRAVAVNAETQGGYAGTPLVVIDGTNAGAFNGLSLVGGDGSFVQGLSIVGFTSASGLLVSGTAVNTTIESNYLGILPDGQTAKPNANGVAITTSGNKVGVPGLPSSNLISGNSINGVLIVGAGATGNSVANDLIGTDKTGFFAVGNRYGVNLAGANNTVGGATSASRNVISGNLGPTGQDGIGILFQGDSTGNVVQNNLIGTDISAGTGSNTTGAVPNVYGIYFGTPGGSQADMVALDTIGGTVAGVGNIISGNVVGITGSLTGGLIAGNFIGLAGPAGSKAVPNGAGILLGGSSTTIGGTAAPARNFISASSGTNNASGIGLELSGDGDLVQGNYIGPFLTSASDLAANAALQNQTGASFHLTNSTIGGTAAGAGNVISGNVGDGLVLDTGAGNLIQGNSIGLTPNLQQALPNGGSGIAVTLTSPTPPPTQPLALNDTIGGTVAGAGNTIAYNVGSNIIVRGTYPTGVTGLTIRGNSIFGNQKPGIDLTGTGVPTPSTLFLTSANLVAPNVNISGVFQGLPSTTYGIDIFGILSTSPVANSGFGPGQAYLARLNVTTDGTGLATFTTSIAAPTVNFAALSATSTGPDGNTSEFSANLPAAASTPMADLVVTSTASLTSLPVGNPVTLVETVTNNGPSPANNVRLFDTVSLTLANVQVVTTLGTASVDGQNVVTALLGTLAAGQSATISITGTTTQQGSVVDTAGAFGTTLDPNIMNNEASQTITVTPATGSPNADLAITKVAVPTTGQIGANLTYTVTVTNNGPGTSTNATVNDFLPASVTLLSANSSQGAAPSVNGTLITDNLGTIAPGATATLTIVVRPTAAGTITNAANVSGNQFDPHPGDNSTSVSTVVRAPSVSLVLSASVFRAVGTVGQIQLFTFTVTNSGTDPAPDVTIINSLPTNGTFILAAPSQGATPAPVNGVITDNLGTVPAGGTATLTIVIVPNSPGALTNFAGVYSPDLPSVPASFAYGSILIQPVTLGPSVTGLAGSGNNSQLVISFDSALNPTTATNRANYRLIATGPKGKNRSIAIAAATYNQINHTVSIVPAGPLNANQTYQLTVIGNTSSGIADTQGRRLVGTPGGASGTNYTANFLAGTLPQV